MKRHEYIKRHAIELHRLCKKMQKLSDRSMSDQLSPRQAEKLNAEMNWTGMYIGQTEERIAFALGLLLPENAREEWSPSAWHKYKGIRFELEKTKFD